jgi:hypothetical protein
MSTEKIANVLVELCRQGKNLEAIEQYYSPDVVSVESMSGPERETTGLDAVLGKSKWWVENHEVHSAEVNGPYLGENQFALEFKYDVTQKFSGKRLQMHEMGLYTVAGDKITHEHFFYPTGG